MNRKSLSILIVLNFISFSLFAGLNDVVIKGKVTNKLSEEIEVSYTSFEGVWLDYVPNEHKAKLDKNGKFSLSFSVPYDYTLVRIQHGNEATEIFASKGDKLEMTVDASDFDNTLKYEGDAVVANFMAEHMRQIGFMRNYYSIDRKLKKNEPRAYIKSVDSLTKLEFDFLVNHLNGLPQSFVKLWNAEWNYKKYVSLMEYPFMHEVMKHRTYKVKVPQENYVTFSKVPRKFNDNYLQLSSYRKYVMSYFENELKAKGVIDSARFFQEKCDELAHQKMPLGSKKYYFANKALRDLKYSPIEESKSNYANYVTKYGSDDYQKFLKKTLDKRISLSSGHKAIDFEITGANDVKGKLSDLKGKVVYIDFWASWCGPCKGEFKHNPKLKEHFKGKDVAFVYVSIDEDEEAWKKAIKKYHLNGYHIRTNGWRGDIAQDYSIRGVPTYYLLDKEGNFAVDVAPRPSSGEELINEIEKLL